MTPRGRFLTVEGIDGAGKSTHVTWLAERIRAMGHEVVMTREPGGTPVGEALRDILLHQPMDAASEALLMFAARLENLKTCIEPALARGTWVVSDRFTDATFAYQGAGKGVPEDRLEFLESWIQHGLEPDLTLLFDVDVEIAGARLRDAREPDKFERESRAFFEKVRAGYLARAAQAPQRIHVIAAHQPVTDIRKVLEKLLLKL